MTDQNEIELQTALPNEKEGLKTEEQLTPLIQFAQITIKVQDIVDKIPLGRFHYRFMFIVFLHYFSAAYVTYNLGYILMYPKYQCIFNDQKYFSECQREQICSNQDGLINEWRVDDKNELSLNNWVTRLDLMCADSFYIGLYGSLDFFGQLFASVFLTPLADKYGKRWFTIIGSSSQILTFIIILVFQNRVLYYFSILILGITFINKNFVTYSHLMDFIGQKGSFVTGWLFCLDSFNFIFSPLILYFITKNTQVFAWIGLVITCTVVASLKFIYFPESLKFTLNQGNYEKAKADSKQIMSENGDRLVDYLNLAQLIDKYETQQKKEQEKNKTNEDQVDEKPSIRKLIFTTRYTIRNLLLMIICWISTSTSFFIFNFYIKYIQANIYVIGVAMGFSCFGYLYSDIVVQRLGFAKCLSISYAIASILMGLIIFIDPNQISVYIYALMFFMLKSFVCMSYSGIFVSHVYLFDSRILATSYGICGLFSRIAMLFIPMIVEIPNKKIPLVILLIMNMSAFGASFLLKKIDQ
ncbi:solute carrier family 22 member 4 [Stylonychia lemnae]|uniref:Solute carrier family 22 member 4 n=1 Tax=Stylonychia lemnae TaxID=5949 RepID=A0A078A937_STYLE|nr:solute carrier family 22 member 4 [Stylonychia lemnae]|eukprot:CDW78072.1 solute carrier family 22 member 4 [Stylonychia lemnae]